MVKTLIEYLKNSKIESLKDIDTGEYRIYTYDPGMVDRKQYVVFNLLSTRPQLTGKHLDEIIYDVNFALTFYDFERESQQTLEELTYELELYIIKNPIVLNGIPNNIYCTKSEYIPADDANVAMAEFNLKFVMKGNNNGN